MEKINTVLCLGNQTEDSDIQCRNWSKLLNVSYRGLLTLKSELSQGLYFPDLNFISIDDIWQLTDSIDLLLLLDQPIPSYDFVETFRHYEALCKYKKRFMPVLIASEDIPTLWLIDCQDNKQILPKVIAEDIQKSNLVIKLLTVTDIDSFRIELEKISAELKRRKCRWVFYRASKHEPLHYEVTRLLLTYPEFVLLNPAVFQGNIKMNIQRRIYSHWINLYL